MKFTVDMERQMILLEYDAVTTEMPLYSKGFKLLSEVWKSRME